MFKKPIFLLMIMIFFLFIFTSYTVAESFVINTNQSGSDFDWRRYANKKREKGIIKKVFNEQNKETGDVSHPLCKKDGEFRKNWCNNVIKFALKNEKTGDCKFAKKTVDYWQDHLCNADEQDICHQNKILARCERYPKPPPPFAKDADTEYNIIFKSGIDDIDNYCHNTNSADISISEDC